MRASLTLAALVLALAACSNSRSTMDDMDKPAGTTARAGMFDASYSQAVGARPGSRGGSTRGGDASGQLSSDDVVLDDGSYVDVYGVELSAGDQLTVDMMSSGFDTYLVVLGPREGNAFENDDFEGSTAHSRLSMTASEPGAYAILATSFMPGATGAYTLTVEAPAELVTVPASDLK